MKKSHRFKKKISTDKKCLIVKSSPNLRAYCLAREITRRAAAPVAMAVSHFERIRPVRHVPHYRRPSKTNRWRDKRARKAIATEFVVRDRDAVPKHLALEVSKYLFINTHKNFTATSCHFLMENHLTHLKK